jgi:2-dehydro-3-deoxyphosphooctonate aldolase (KDO 8-P synthase)
LLNEFEVGTGLQFPAKVGSGELVFIGGPCAIESEMHALEMADAISNICRRVGVPFIYKSCYDKDCRSDIKSFHGAGLNEGLRILEGVRQKYGVPVVSDFSDPAHAPDVGSVCDMIQVPAYLCRQTSILRAAATTGRPVHLKKGQFMSPWNMKNSLRKLQSFGCKSLVMTDRGTFFGYNMLVNDFRCLPIMKDMGAAVGFDATHSVQLPTSMGNVSGGQREFIPHLVRSAVSAGVDVLFMEVHNDPPRAKSDPNTVLNLKFLESILTQAKVIHQFVARVLEQTPCEISPGE